MPSVNPFIESSDHGGIPSLFVNQYSAPGVSQLPDQTQSMWTSPAQTQTVNAAGTSENVALHAALFILFALVGLYLFRQAGVRFAVTAGVGR